MRQIKFRAWDKKYKEMINDIHIAPEYDWLVLSDNDALAERDNRGRNKNEEYILMQFTGLKDKNGKEIYEGDIVEDDSKDNGADFAAALRNGKYEVKWAEENCCFSLGGYYMQISKTQAKKLEVIGNIYENPELLTKKYVSNTIYNSQSPNPS